MVGGNEENNITLSTQMENNSVKLIRQNQMDPVLVPREKEAMMKEAINVSVNRCLLTKSTPITRNDQSQEDCVDHENMVKMHVEKELFQMENSMEKIQNTRPEDECSGANQSHEQENDMWMEGPSKPKGLETSKQSSKKFRRIGKGQNEGRKPLAIIELNQGGENRQTKRKFQLRDENMLETEGEEVQGRQKRLAMILWPDMKETEAEGTSLKKSSTHK